MDQLKKLDQWVCYRQKPKFKHGEQVFKANGKPKFDKVPIDPKTGQNAKTNDPNSWSNYQTAVSGAKNFRADGIGFVFTHDAGIVGIDLDDCITADGTINDFANEILEQFKSYAEYSPSEDGIHILVRGSIPKALKQKEIEVYDSGRFFTVTENLIPGFDRPIATKQDELNELFAKYLKPTKATEKRVVSSACQYGDEDILQKAFNAKNGSKFRALWNGNFSGYSSQSEADLAFCQMLSFWTRKDASQINSLFKQSALYRDKWDEKHKSNGATYGRMTIEKAIEMTTEIYSPTDKEALSISTPQDQSGWRIRSLKDAFRDRPPVDYIIDGLIPTSSLTAVFGAPGTLKSMVLADLCAAVVAGDDWLTDQNHLDGIQTNQYPALWLDLDNGSRRTDERFEAVAKARGLTAESAFYNIVLPNPPFNAGDEASIQNLEHVIKQTRAKIVVIDNLSRITGRTGENDSSMGMVMGNLRTLAEHQNIAIILIHHQRKTNSNSNGNSSGRLGDSLRGHSSIEASLDLALLVTRDGQSNNISITPTKVRGVEIAPLFAKFDFTHKPESTELHTAQFWKIEGNDTKSKPMIKQKVISCLQSSGTIKQGDLVQMVKEKGITVGDKAIIKVLKDMHSNGNIEQVKGPQNANLYSLSKM